ncbi:MAG: CBS domain-containing protein [Chitinophagales bacterium]
MGRRRKLTDILASLSVSEAMTSRVVTLNSETPLDEAMEITMQFGHALYPVMEGQEILGVVTYERLLGASKNQPAEIPVKSLTTGNYNTISMDCSLKEAVEIMSREEVGRILVVHQDDRQHLIGVLSRSDVLAAFDQETSGRENP